MTSVFIGGSRKIGRMNAEPARRFDNIVQKGLYVIVNDANGFDRLAQAYFAERRYASVTVHCTNGVARNNVGGWPLKAVPYAGRDRGPAFYTAKDDAMLDDADYGLFGWDGKSTRTLRNVRLMAERSKPSAVYVSTIKAFVTVRTPQDVAALSPDMSVPPQAGELFPDLPAPTPPDQVPSPSRVA